MEPLDERLWTLGMALEAASQAGPSTRLRDARLFAEHQLSRRGAVTDLSADRFFALWVRFVKYAEAHRVHRLEEVSAELVADFVLRARTSKGATPSVATMHLRRDAVRLMYKVLREFAIWAVDPTVDLALPPRSGLLLRSLTDAEVEACHWAALSTVGSTRQPALWALGEAGASTREIAKIIGVDVDLDAGQVWISGAPRTDARWAPLTEWGAAQLGRRIRHLRAHPEALVAFDSVVDEHAGRISAGMALSGIMARAGLGQAKGVKPRSLTAWVGRRVWLDTGRIDEAARRLGMRSLDLTAELIGFDWRAEQDPA